MYLSFHVVRVARVEPETARGKQKEAAIAKIGLQIVTRVATSIVVGEALGTNLVRRVVCEAAGELLGGHLSSLTYVYVPFDPHARPISTPPLPLGPPPDSYLSKARCSAYQH